MLKNIYRKYNSPAKSKLLFMPCYFGYITKTVGFIFFILFTACTVILLHYFNRADQWHHIPINFFYNQLIFKIRYRVPSLKLKWFWKKKWLKWRINKMTWGGVGVGVGLNTCQSNQTMLIMYQGSLWCLQYTTIYM